VHRGRVGCVSARGAAGPGSVTRARTRAAAGRAGAQPHPAAGGGAIGRRLRGLLRELGEPGVGPAPADVALVAGGAPAGQAAGGC
jgi:hypothetical protein